MQHLSEMTMEELEAAYGKYAEENPPPNSMAAEQSILGIILRWQETFEDVSEKLVPEDFYMELHRTIYRQMQVLAQVGKPLDPVTVGDALDAQGRLEDCGGRRYLGTMCREAFSRATLRTHIGIMRNHGQLRRVLEATEKIAAMAKAKNNAPAVLEAALDQLGGIAMGATRSTHFQDATTLARSTIDELERRFESQTEVWGIPTGITELDRMLGGLQDGELTVVAGRPSMGKTAFALCAATHAAQKGHESAVFSLEMPGRQLALRSIAGFSGVGMSRLRVGNILDTEWGQVANAVDRFRKLPLYVDETAGLSVDNIRARAKALKRQHDGLSLIVVDYLQLLRVDDQRSRNETIGQASRELKILAKDLDVPVMVLSQLNRNLEMRTNKRPCLADLRDSGAIEQDADAVILLYRDEAYNPRSVENQGLAELILAKQRNGPTGTVYARWSPETCTFQGCEKDFRPPRTVTPLSEDMI